MIFGDKSIRKMKRKRIFFALAILSLLIPSPYFTRTYISMFDLRKSEQSILELVNSEREKQGVVRLIFNEDLYKIAMGHNLKMAAEDRLAHTFPQYKKLAHRMIDKNLFFVSAGENIAFSNVYPSDFIHEGFVKSSSHYENLIDKKFRHCGIAILETDRGFYITQEFAEIIFDSSEENAAKKIKDFINKESIFSDHKTSEKIEKKFRKELKRLSEEFLYEGSISEIPKKLRGFNLLTVKSNKISDIKNFIKAANNQNDYNSFAMGITFGRSDKFPGGVFSVIFLLNKGLKRGGVSLGEMEPEVIKILNRILIKSGGRGLIYNNDLSLIAGKIVDAYYKGDNSIKRNRKYSILAYQAVDPFDIPEEHLGFFFSKKKKRSVGISILRPEENGISTDYYLIAFVLTN